MCEALIWVAGKDSVPGVNGTPPIGLILLFVPTGHLNTISQDICMISVIFFNKISAGRPSLE